MIEGNFVQQIKNSKPRVSSPVLRIFPSLYGLRFALSRFEIRASTQVQYYLGFEIHAKISFYGTGEDVKSSKTPSLPIEANLYALH